MPPGQRQPGEGQEGEAIEWPAPNLAHSGGRSSNNGHCPRPSLHRSVVMRLDWQYGRWEIVYTY